jgi:hypothetical protein
VIGQSLEHPWIVVEADPARGRERAVGCAPTFDGARADAAERNRRLTADEGVPARAPFRFYFAANKSGHVPTPPHLRVDLGGTPAA